MNLNNSNNVSVAPPPHPETGQRCLLGVRNYRSQWKPPEYLELLGRRWYLQSAFIGSEWCGHQVALARSCNDRWSLYDSDGVRLGIGPLSWSVSSHEKWWEQVPYAVPFSNKGAQSKFCDVNPQNRHPLKIIHELLRAEGIRRFMKESQLENSQYMQVNVDWIYCSI